MRLLLSLIVLPLLMSVSTTAHAAWSRASSRHFVIYGEQNPSDLKAYAEKLERFDSAVRLSRRMRDPEVGDGNRLTVFVVRDVKAVQDLKRRRDDFAAGFYIPRASGSVAVVPRSVPSGNPDTIFFHEYAHHLMLSDIAKPMPAWFIEGFAEFMATANVRRDGSVELGLPANHRARNLLSPLSVEMPLANILAGRQPRSNAERSSLYARSWLLTHFFYFSQARSGQLSAYLDEFSRGKSAAVAAQAFGELRQLDREVDSYLRKQSFPYLNLDSSRLSITPVSVTPLSKGDDAAMRLHMELQTRVQRNPAEQAAKARQLAARYPSDFLVQITLAEAEWVNRDYAAAERAADTAAALEPRSAEALVWKGRAILSRAASTRSEDLFRDSRSVFNRANRLDVENPEPLLYFYRSFVEQGIRPTENAVDALHYAAKLAPQDLEVALNSAGQYLRDGKRDEARPLLLLIAQHPHAVTLGPRAAALLEQANRAPAPR